MTGAAQSREAVRDALESGKPKDNDGLPVKLVLTIGMLPRPGRHSRVAIVSLEGVPPERYPATRIVAR